MAARNPPESRGEAVYTPLVDRSELLHFLEDPGVTLRWGKGDTAGYCAVEVRHGGLRWYRWSHEQGRPLEEQLQSAAEYRAAGPAMDAPTRVRKAIEDALRTPPR